MQLMSSQIHLQSPKCPSALLLQRQSLTTNTNPSSSSCISPKTKRPNFLLQCRRSEYFEPQHQKFTKPSDTGVSQRVFVGHSIYKGKAALTVEPKSPEFSPLESGSLKLFKEGCILLQFAPAVGIRQYDWNRKQNVFPILADNGIANQNLKIGEIGIMVLYQCMKIDRDLGCGSYDVLTDS
ncbi:hypothetical protein GIB67_005041 [Kingdonia uniflora]|uniref:Uncharacterized protein n=1 Tax=Kingdonia uniflora TaxID=39325 RepID=A0A7J7NMR9_9MAGN|nr:hypothetical protein GIB67_005041 [Kingdonia uniflora]